MKGRLILLLAGLMALAGLMVLFPLSDLSADWQNTVDREKAIREARRVARHFDIDVEGWSTAVTASRNHKSIFFRREFPENRAARAMTPITIKAAFISPDRKRRFEVDIGVRGRAHGFRRREPDLPEETSAAKAQEIARESLLFLARQQADLFTPLGQEKIAEGAAEGDDQKLPKTVELTWEATSLRDDYSAPQLEIEVQGELVTSAGLRRFFTPKFNEIYNAHDQPYETLGIGSVFAVFALVMTGLVFYLIGSVRREIRHRLTFAGFILVGLPLIIIFWTGGEIEEGRAGRDSILENVVKTLAFLLIVTLPVIAAFPVVGNMLGARRDASRMIRMEILLSGGFLKRPVGDALFAGVMYGFVLALIPTLVCISRIFPGAAAALARPQGWVAPAPFLASFDFFSGFTLIGFLCVFGFISPLVWAYVRNRVAAHAIVFISAVPLLAVGPVESSASAALFCGALYFGIGELNSRRNGLLSVLVMVVSLEAVRNAVAMALQPQTSFLLAAVGTFGILFILAGYGFVVAEWGREINLQQAVIRRENEAQLAAQQHGAEHDRLLAEFSVARRAQEQMLPASPPDLEGYDLAAVCRPAREVGGDLYDFIDLENGRWGITVADVSGKGVPAALYMTLTKGLLSSVARDALEPRDIVREVNQHLYQCGKRRVFVTLALGVIEPANGTVLCTRAGHNPMVWWRSEAREARFLNSSGIGLGLTKGRLFDRSLAVEEIRMSSGDALVLYSDGITEAMDSNGNEYGNERFQQAVAETDGLDARQTLDRLLEDVNSYVGETPQHDDMTLVVLRTQSNGATA